MYRESTEIGRPPHGAGVIGLGELQSHESLQGLHHHHLGVGGRLGENAEEGVDEERIGEHPQKGGLGETQNARIDIRINGRSRKKNQTYTPEMSPMWAD